MFNDLRNLVKHSSIYTFGNIASKMIGIILIPLYTKVLVVEIFGIYSILEVTMQFLMGFLHFGLPTAMIRWLSLEKYKDKKRTILFSVTLTLFLIGLLNFSLFYLFKKEISFLLFSNYKHSFVLLIISIIIRLRLINRPFLNYLRYLEKSLTFTVVNLTRFLVQLLVTIYFVAFLKFGLIGIFNGLLAGELIIAVLLLPQTIREFSLKFETKEIIEMLKFGFPLSFSSISNRILNMGDRYVLGFLTNWSLVGIYSLGYKFANLIDTIFIKAFRTAFLPTAWKKLHDKNAKSFYSKLFTYYIFFIFWISTFISIYAKEIIQLFARNESYWNAYIITPIAVFSIGIKGSFSILRMGLQFQKKTKYIAYIVIISALLNIGLNFVLIPFWGMIGAALATFISFVFMIFLAYKISNSFYSINFEWRRILKIIITIIILYLLAISSNQLYWIFKILIKLILFLSFPFILYLFKFYEEKEINRIKGSWSKWKNIDTWKKIISSKK